MAEYQAKSTSSLVFDLTEGDISIGKIAYKSWFKFEVSIKMANGNHYQVESRGFWGTTIELRNNENVLLKFSMSWNGDIVIQMLLGDVEKGYIFKHRGIFKETYVLEDQDGVELLVMKPQMKWSKMSYEYLITTSDDFEILSDKEVLLMTSLHCANYYVSMMSAYQ